MLILIPCPQCQAPAEVADRFWLASTDGDVEHLVVDCAAGHHFRMPLDSLPDDVQPLAAESEPAAQAARIAMKPLR